MCRVRIIHFTPHDVRVPIATQLFTALGGPDEFTATQLTKDCRCLDSATQLLETNKALGNPSCFQRGRVHRCCVQRTFPAVRCQWMLDHMDPMHNPAECPNYLEDNEYWPIEMVVDTTGSDAKAEVCASGDWKRAGEERPFFPAAELFYDENVEEWLGNPGTYDLKTHRFMAEACGQDLLEAKGVVQQLLVKTETCLQELEQTLSTDAGLEWAALNPLTFWSRVEMAEGLIQKLNRAELGAARLFKEMMRYIRVVLTVIERMPDEGGNIAALDGSYTISREQLDIGNLRKPEEVRDACDGTLKQAANFRDRLRGPIGQQILKALPDLFPNLVWNVENLCAGWWY